jgi:Ca2+-binding RTX toxin-like protein
MTMHLQPLESRKLLAAATSLVNGVLTLTGTAAAENYYLTYQVSDASIKLYDNGAIGGSWKNGTVKKVVINTLGGDDYIFVGGIGSNTIPCTIDSGDGNDRITAGAFNDVVTTGNGNDVVNGADGNDSIDGGTGNDTLTGGNGNDTLLGHAGDDALIGSNGDDLLDGGIGADNMQGSGGTDTVTYATRTRAVTVDARNASDELADDGELGERDFVTAETENIIGGSGNDKLTGTSIVGSSLPSGYSRNNKLVGNGGNDTLIGLDGNDQLDGGIGTDIFDAGDGTDTVLYTCRTDSLTLNLDGIANDGTLNERDHIMANVENLTGGNGADEITGNTGNNALSGGGGNDSITGLAGNDTIDGGTGLDSLFGNEGDDLFRAEDGQIDRIDGGLGTDLFADIVITGKPTEDSVDRTAEGDLVNDVVIGMED